MQPSDSQELESYVPVYDVVPEKWEDARAFIVEQLKRLANAVNVREIGFFLDQELLAGKFFIPGISIAEGGGSSQQFRTVLRKVINFGTLPNSGSKSVPHGIDFDTNFTLVFLGGYATNPTNLNAIPLPFSSPTLNQNILLYIDSVNVNVITALNYTNYTTCFVTIEYMQEL
jgi:hypothetical protein